MFETTPTMRSRQTVLGRLVGCSRFGSRLSRAVGAMAIGLTVALFSTSVEAQIGPGDLQSGEAEQSHMEIVGWWGGPVRDIAVEDVAIYAISTRVVVLDVSDKNNPQRTDEIDVEFVVRDVELRDGYAYVVTCNTLIAGITHQFSIIDVRDPDSAEIVYYTPSLNVADFFVQKCARG